MLSGIPARSLTRSLTRSLPDPDAPDTGDHSSLAMRIALLFVCGGLLIGIVYRHKKEAED